MAGRLGGGRTRRWLVAVLVAALGVSVAAVPVAAQEAGAGPGGFGDVAQDAFHADAVEALAGDDVFAGTECAEGLCGGADIDRKTMAVWVVRVLDGEDPAAVTASRFDDVDASGFHAPFIERMAALNVTAGCGDGSGFCPDDTVDRAQMAVFLSRAFNLAAGPNAGFVDVASDAWYRDAANSLAASGVTAGCGDGTRFCPSDHTTRAQMAVFLARATGAITAPLPQAPATLLSYTTPEAMDASEAWPSPDWRHVAYFATVTSMYEAPDRNEVGELYVAAADGSNLTKVASDVLGDGGCPADGAVPRCYPAVWWSPDSSRFWYVTIEARDDQGEATSFSLRVAAADGTRSVQITQGSPGIRRDDFCDPCDYGWSFDSQHIAYSIEGDNEGLFVVAADGTNPTRLTDDAYSSWAWSPDSGHIAYEDRESSSEVVLYSARADGTNPSRLAAVRDWWWSPDGSRIAYLAGDYDDELYRVRLFAVLADGSGTVKLGDDASTDVDVVWSPDSRHISYYVYVRESGEYVLYSARADGSGAVKLGDDAASLGWSPDGSRIAYVADGALFTALADGSGTTKTAQDVDLGRDGTRFQWSPDGSYIAYGTEEEDGRSLYTAKADGSSPPRLVTDSFQWSWLARPVWSPDGSHISYLTGYSGCTAGSGLFTARADGSKATKLSDDALSPVWSPDSTRIAYWTFQPDPEPEDYDPGAPWTWPDANGFVEVSGTGGESIAKLATGHKVGTACPVFRLDPYLAWRLDGIEAKLVFN